MWKWWPGSVNAAFLTCPAAAHLAADALGEAIYAYNLTLVHTASDQFLLVARFNLKGDLGAFGVNDTGHACHALTDGRRREMSNLDFHSHGAFVIVEGGRHRLTRRPFEPSDEIRRREHRGHPAIGKVNGMTRLNCEAQFAARADF